MSRWLYSIVVCAALTLMYMAGESAGREGARRAPALCPEPACAGSDGALCIKHMTDADRAVLQQLAEELNHSHGGEKKFKAWP